MPLFAIRFELRVDGFAVALLLRPLDGLRQRERGAAKRLKLRILRRRGLIRPAGKKQQDGECGCDDVVVRMLLLSSLISLSASNVRVGRYVPLRDGGRAISAAVFALRQRWEISNSTSLP